MTRKLCPDCPVGAAHLVHGKRARVICCRIGVAIESTPGSGSWTETAFFGVDAGGNATASYSGMRSGPLDPDEIDAFFGGPRGDAWSQRVREAREALERSRAQWGGGWLKPARVISVRDVGPYQPDPKCEVLP